MERVEIIVLIDCRSELENRPSAQDKEPRGVTIMGDEVNVEKAESLEKKTSVKTDEFLPDNLVKEPSTDLLRKKIEEWKTVALVSGTVK